jgi:flagellar biosynthetic protein FlhB
MHVNRYRLHLNIQFFAQEKTEKATPRKRSEARKKGQVARSQEIASAFILLFVFIALYFLAGYYLTHLQRVFSVTFQEYMLLDLSIPQLKLMAVQLMNELVMLLVPVFLIAVVVGIFANFAQFGLLFTGYPLQPKLSKLNPINGIKHIFSLRSVVNFAKSILKFIIIGIIVAVTIWNDKDRIINLAKVPVGDIFAYAAKMTWLLGILVAVALIILAILDYFYQKYEHEKSLRMSKQEVKDEHKKVEGDPLIKSRIREKQRSLALQRMMQALPKADVVITNPTHYAVALQYDQNEMDAPKVIAKGKDYVALKIREKAEELGIVIMENRPLARALYDKVEIGQMIPPELFQAVAEVLAYVYRLKRRA